MDTIPPLPQIPVPGKDGSVLGGVNGNLNTGV